MPEKSRSIITWCSNNSTIVGRSGRGRNNVPVPKVHDIFQCWLLVEVRSEANRKSKGNSVACNLDKRLSRNYCMRKGDIK